MKKLLISIIFVISAQACQAATCSNIKIVRESISFNESHSNTLQIMKTYNVRNLWVEDKIYYMSFYKGYNDTISACQISINDFFKIKKMLEN